MRVQMQLAMPMVDNDDSASASASASARQPQALKTLCLELKSFTRKASRAALVLHALTQICCHVNIPFQADIVSKIFAIVGALESLKHVLHVRDDDDDDDDDAAAEPLVTPRDVEDVMHALAACYPVLEKIWDAQRKMGEELGDVENDEAGDTIIVGCYLFQESEEGDVLKTFEECFETAVRVGMGARKEMLFRDGNGTIDEMAERRCLIEASGSFTRSDGVFEDINSGQAGVYFAGNTQAQPQPIGCQDQFWKDRRNRRAMGISSQSSSTSTRNNTPEESASKVDTSNVEKKDVNNKESGLPTSTPTQDKDGGFNLTQKLISNIADLSLDPQQHLEAYVLLPQVQTFSNSATWSYVVENLPLDQNAIATQIIHPGVGSSVFATLCDLLPAQVHLIQARTQLRHGTLVSIQQGRDIDLGTPMGTYHAKSLIFIIKTAAPSSDEDQINSTAPFFFQDKSGDKNQQFTTITASDRHRIQDHSLEEIRLADYQADRKGPGVPTGDTTYPWEKNVVHGGAARQISCWAHNPNTNGPLLNAVTTGPASVGQTDGGLFARPDGLFGTQNRASGGLFGQLNTQPPSQGLFGQPNTQQPSQGLFGRASAPPQPAQSLFGTQPPASGCLFGQPNNAPPSQGVFGTQAQRGGGLFGQSNNTPNSQGLFGRVDTTQPSQNLFGQPNVARPSQGLFGGAPATSLFEQRNNLAQPQNSFSINLYGGAPCTNLLDGKHNLPPSRNTSGANPSQAHFQCSFGGANTSRATVGTVDASADARTTPSLFNGPSHAGNQTPQPTPDKNEVQAPGHLNPASTLFGPSVPPSDPPTLPKTNMFAKAAESAGATEVAKAGEASSKATPFVDQPVPKIPTAQKTTEKTKTEEKKEMPPWLCKKCETNLSFHPRAEQTEGVCDVCQGLLQTTCWLCEKRVRKMKECDDVEKKTEQGKGKAEKK